MKMAVDTVDINVGDVGFKLKILVMANSVKLKPDQVSILKVAEQKDEPAAKRPKTCSPSWCICVCVCACAPILLLRARSPARLVPLQILRYVRPFCSLGPFKF